MNKQQVEALPAKQHNQVSIFTASHQTSSDDRFQNNIVTETNIFMNSRYHK